MTQSVSILIIDDEPNLRQSLSLILQREGYLVTAAGNGADALKYLDAGGFGLVFLDIKMPDVNGIDLLAKIREHYPELPVFILTAHATLETAMKAVHNGANDYLLKPIEPHAILDRVREVLQKQKHPRRRREIASQMHELLEELKQIEEPAAAGTGASDTRRPVEVDRYIQRGVFTLDLHTRLVRFADRSVSLAPSTFNFLVSLARHSPDPVTYEILVKEAQGYDLNRVEAREMARGQMHELRKALEPDLRHPRYIITVRDHGYRLVA